MAESATSAERSSGRDDSREVAELREELARSRQEVLRLRDLLIGKDAEVGMMRGRLAELEEGSARLVIAAARLRARLPTSAAALRRLRRTRD
jgi:hypothetical protein